MTELVLKTREGARLLSGKPNGMTARLEYKLDELDRQPNDVTVHISVRIMTSSFILGMFAKSVDHLGLEGFLSKYHFDANPSIVENIRDNARFSATKGTALSS